MSIQTSVLLSSRDGEITPDLARIDLNTVHSGPEWEESLEVPEEEMREEGGFVSVDGYLYRPGARGQEGPQVQRHDRGVGQGGSHPVSCDLVSLFL